MYKFGKHSLTQLKTCHKDLQLILIVSLRVSDIDFGISEGHRSIEIQKKYYDEGKSKLDGINKLGKHNYKPSLAADYYAVINGKASYDKETLSYLAGLFHGVSQMLYEQNKISHGIRWGGNWDMDGEILIDQTFDDRPHIELILRK